jgi:lysophospholipase L1-like esterase
MENRMISSGRKFFYYLLLFLIISYYSPFAQSREKIAAFGSSVCNGSGDNLNKGGYIGRFKNLMKKYGWEVVNVSRPGDNTTTINERWQKTKKIPSKPVRDDQYLLDQKPSYVIIGLSLNNEGIRKVPEEKQDSIIDKFENGLLEVIEKCRDEGFRVIVSNCYANGLFSEKQYELTKKMNLVINGWDLPSINLLGALDDGHGRWPIGFNYDDIHPSGGGHQEMYYAIVPTLFDAIKSGKPVPEFIKSNKYVSVIDSKNATFSFSPADTIHSFAVSFLVRNHGNCVLAKIQGRKAVLTEAEFRVKQLSKIGLVLSASSEIISGKIEIKNNELIYSSGNDKILKNKIDNDKWHRVTLSHRLANGETLFYIDSILVGNLIERIVPDKFLLGIAGKVDYKDILIYRSSLNIDEVKTLVDGKLIQSSLEIYSPLNDENISIKSELKNFAQSMSILKKDGKIKGGKSGSLSR